VPLGFRSTFGRTLFAAFAASASSGVYLQASEALKIPNYEFTMFGKKWKVSSVHDLADGGKLIEYVTDDDSGDAWVFNLSAQSDPVRRAQYCNC
jgi:hypothetical protein